MVHNSEKGYFLTYDCTDNGYSHPDARDLIEDAVQLNAEGFQIGCTEKYLKKGCLINVFLNRKRYIFSDDENLDNLEKLLAKYNLPFEKGERKQAWKTPDGIKWEKAEIYVDQSPNRDR
jgi:hypothetical protein